MNAPPSLVRFARASSVTLIVVALVSSASAQALFRNSITGTNPSAYSPYTLEQELDPHVTASGIGRGPGIAGSSANDRYNASSWNTGDFDDSAYFTWTLTPDSGYAVDIFSFNYFAQRSGTGPTAFSFRTSLDDFAMEWGAPGVGSITIDLPDGVFQGVPDPIEFRLYGWGASTAGGTFSINDFMFTGTTYVASAIPESSTVAFVVGFAALSFAMVRRRKRRENLPREL